MFSVTTGAYSFMYDNIQQHITDRCLQRNPEYNQVIKVCLRKRVIDETEIEENFNVYIKHGIEYLRSYRAKIKPIDKHSITFLNKIPRK